MAARTDTGGAGHATTWRAFRGVRLLVNERNMGFGWSYRRGVEAAALDHIVMVHGDNAWGRATLREFFSHVGEADIIIGYTRRHASRRARGRGTAHLEDVHAAASTSSRGAG